MWWSITRSSDAVLYHRIRDQRETAGVHSPEFTSRSSESEVQQLEWKPMAPILADIMMSYYWPELAKTTDIMMSCYWPELAKTTGSCEWWVVIGQNWQRQLISWWVVIGQSWQRRLAASSDELLLARTGKDDWYHDELLLARAGKDDWQLGEQMAMVEGDQVGRSLA